MTSLDDLFEQIIHTERRAQAKRNFLHEIKTKVQLLKDSIQNTEKECVCLQGQLVSKVQQLNECELGEKLLQSKEKILSQKLDILREEKSNQQDELLNISCRKTEETEVFCKDVEEFIASYSLASNGQAIREQQAKQTIKELQEKHDQLKQANMEYYARNKKMVDLQNQLRYWEKEKESLQMRLNELDNQLLNERHVTADQHKILNSPNMDPEFIKLQQQLESLKSENLEEKCQRLQQELWRLQQQSWQKQVKECQKQQDLKQQTFKQKQQNASVASLNTTNKVQMSNFTSSVVQVNSKDVPENVSEEDYIQVSCPKSLFKKHQNEDYDSENL